MPGRVGMPSSKFPAQVPSLRRSVMFIRQSINITLLRSMETLTYVETLGLRSQDFSVKSGVEMKIQNKTPIIFFAFILSFALFVLFVVPSFSAQKAGGTLYLGTWPRQVLVIDEAAG